MEAAELPTPLPLPLHRSETRIHLGTMVIRDGLLTSEQLEQALADKEDTGRRLGEIVVERGWVSPSGLARALAEQHDLEFLDLAKTELEPTATGLLPEKFARRYEALPIRFVDEDSVLVAVADPTNVLTSDDLRLALGLNVRLAVVSMADLTRTISRIYHSADLDGTIDDAGDLPQGGDVSGVAATSAPAIKLVNSLVARAIGEGASDLHFEPTPKGINVRARIDGVMRKFSVVPQTLQPAVSSRLKIMAE